MTAQPPTSSNQSDLSVSMILAAWMSLLFALPPMILFLSFYISIWGMRSIARGFDALAQHMLAFLIAFVFGIVLHEAVHGLGWLVLGQKPLSAVHFGFQWKTLTPYAHLTEPIDIHAYRWSAVLPAIFIGVIPTIAGILAGSPLMLFFGLAFILGAGGDLFILWLIRGVSSGKQVIDHPTRPGCFVLEHNGPNSISSE